jgi:hypothetical protein
MSTGADWSPAHQLCAQEQTNQEKNEVNAQYSHFIYIFFSYRASVEKLHNFVEYSKAANESQLGSESWIFVVSATDPEPVFLKPEIKKFAVENK